MYKNVKHLIPAENINMGGLFIKQALPTQNVPQVDPYLLLHHATLRYNQNAPAIQQGVGPHPHRGFTPVTFVVEGDVHHRDSRGNNQIAKAGEVQWMHTGAGIIHSERPSQELVDQEGTQEFIQLWVNSPAANKMQVPEYQYLTNDDFKIFTSKDNLVSDKLVAGTYNGQTSKLVTQSPLMILWSTAQKGGNQDYKISENYNSMIYVIKGYLNIKNYGPVEEKSLVVFNDSNESEHIQITAKENAQYLILTGKAIDEPMTQHGPFVMNNQTEILEAMRDYQMGKMGILNEE